MFYLTGVNKILRHSHIWLAQQYISVIFLAPLVNLVCHSILIFSALARIYIKLIRKLIRFEHLLDQPYTL